MTSAFGGQHSIQLSYGCVLNVWSRGLRKTVSRLWRFTLFLAVAPEDITRRLQRGNRRQKCLFRMFRFYRPEGDNHAGQGLF